MAIDEALLSTANDRGVPCLRFYSWNEKAATFGYFQRYAEAEKATGLRPLIRRPTGGGVVPHESDWTYSVVIPMSHEWYGLPACESYCRIHRWVAEALADSGERCELAPESVDGASRCFAGYEANDVLAGGRKVAGAAQRRNKQGLLIQGSIQPLDDWKRGRWEEAMLNRGTTESDVEWVRTTVEELTDESHVQRLVNEKYGDDSFLRRR